MASSYLPPQFCDRINYLALEPEYYAYNLYNFLYQNSLKNIEKKSHQVNTYI